MGMGILHVVVWVYCMYVCLHTACMGMGILCDYMGILHLWIWVYSMYGYGYTACTG